MHAASLPDMYTDRMRKLGDLEGIEEEGDESKLTVLVIVYVVEGGWRKCGQ